MSTVKAPDGSLNAFYTPGANIDFGGVGQRDLAIREGADIMAWGMAHARLDAMTPSLPKAASVTPSSGQSAPAAVSAGTQAALPDAKKK